MDKNLCNLNNIEEVGNLAEVQKLIKAKQEEIRYLEEAYDRMFENNERLVNYYSEKAFLQDEIRIFNRRINELDKLIYLEEHGVDTDKELKQVQDECNDDCESYMYGGYDACKDCDFDYSTFIDILYSNHKNKENKEVENEEEECTCNGTELKELFE